MNIEDKISLCSYTGKIVLIREGLFLRCYQMSLFSLSRHNPSLKILGRKVKKLNNMPVFYGGFPESHIDKFVTGARKTDWGFEVECEGVCQEEYDAWIESQIRNLIKDKPDTSVNIAEKKSVIKDKLCQECKYISEDVLNFLINWHPGLYPQSVDTGFIQGMKKLLCDKETK